MRRIRYPILRLTLWFNIEWNREKISETMSSEINKNNKHSNNIVICPCLLIPVQLKNKSSRHPNKMIIIHNLTTTGHQSSLSHARNVQQHPHQCPCRLPSPPLLVPVKHIIVLRCHGMGIGMGQWLGLWLGHLSRASRSKICRSTEFPSLTVFGSIESHFRVRFINQ